ncbi:MAG TPA: metal-dependent hydrolase [Vicinamibacterales bacterium]|nr:metal-dependent hydrolase [Vicinamibacterales bacterium]
MDNLCHTLAGAALGEAGLKRRTAMGTATLMIASNLPDIDAAVFATDTLAMSFRRGWTHGVLALAVLPALLAGGMLVWDWWRRRADSARPPVHLHGLLLLSYVGTWLHVFMDWLNSYGVRLLKPFSDRWFYGDALYIIDPILYVVFGAAIIMARVAAKRGDAEPRRWASRGLAIAAVYAFVMLASNWWARIEVRSGLGRAGVEGTRFLVTPVLGNPFRREVIVDVGDRYEKGFLWFDPLPHFRPAGYGVETNLSHPAVVGAKQNPRIQAFLMWSRFPFFVVQPTADGTRVFVNDYRYSGSGGRDGWATQSVIVP